MRTLNSLIIGSDENSIAQLREALGRVNPFLSTQSTVMEKGIDRIETLISLESPSIIFLETEDLGAAAPIATQIRRVDRNIQVIAFSRWSGGDDLLNLMRVGIREWLQAPVDDTQLHDALDRVRHELDELPSQPKQVGHLVAFIPAKPGSGASTAVMHLAHSCAAALGRRVALIDLDLNCGTQAFMAKADEGLSVQEAAQYAERMDDALWERIIAAKGQVDLLRTGTLNPGARVDSPQLHRLLSFVERRYPLAFVDLSGNWERYSIDTMERCSMVFQVCTTDLASLHHARRSMDVFHEMGVRDRVQTIVNRATYHTGLDRRAVETILGTKPIAFLPNAFVAIQGALKEASPVLASSPYGQAIAQLKQEILKDSTLAGVMPTEKGVEAKPIWKLQTIKSALGALRSRNTTEVAGTTDA